jgi:ABC-2 type transport system permease protein
VYEKERRTIGAVLTTPATQTDVLVSKGLMGMSISVGMGIVTLALNQAFNEQIGLLVPILILGAVMACSVGLIVGALMRTVASTYTAIKSLNFAVYAPALVTMFPQIPAWIGKIFPTYYVMHPIMELARGGGDWSTISRDVYILIVIDIAFIAAVIALGRTTRQQGV